MINGGNSIATRVLYCAKNLIKVYAMVSDFFFGGGGDYRSVCRVLETHGKGSFTHGKAFAAFGVC